MKTLIFSDVHLKVTQEDKEEHREFISFLRGIDPAEFDRIIILGDLFDFWFEYKHVVFSGYFNVLRAFAELRDQGIDLHLVCGNHDFWAGRFLRDELGMQIHRIDYRCTFGDRRVLLIHGDGMNPKDVSYRIYKSFARSRLVIWLFSLLHPDWAMWIAEAASNASRVRYERRHAKWGEEPRSLHDFAKEVLAMGGVDVLLCGHTHEPVKETLPTPQGPGLYINTGDWLNRRSYVVWDGERFALKVYGEARVASSTSSAAEQRTEEVHVSEYIADDQRRQGDQQPE